MKRSRKKKTIGDFIWRLVFLAALVVFCYCAFQLVTIYLEYKKGTDEYSSLEQQYVTEDTISGTTENKTPSGTGDGTRTGATEVKPPTALLKLLEKSRVPVRPKIPTPRERPRRRSRPTRKERRP